MRVYKRVVSVILIILWNIAVLPGITINVNAENNYDDFAYYVSNLGVTIFGYTGTAKNLEIPDHIEKEPVVEIADKAFYDCDSLDTVIIPDGVKRIGQYAFEYCDNLRKVSIPDTVEYIGYGGFADCKSLKSVKLSKNLNILNLSLFSNCESLTSIIIPNGVTTIESYVFGWCYSLKSITIPKSVEKIDKTALYNCLSLKDIYYEGTKDQWNSIIPNNTLEIPDEASIHYNSLGPTNASENLPSGDADSSVLHFDSPRYTVAVGETITIHATYKSSKIESPPKVSTDPADYDAVTLEGGVSKNYFDGEYDLSFQIKGRKQVNGTTIKITVDGFTATVDVVVSGNMKNFRANKDGWPIINAFFSFGYKSTSEGGYHIPFSRYFDSNDVSFSTFINSVANQILKWNGSCFGMCLSSIAQYNGQINLKPLSRNTTASSNLVDFGYDASFYQTKYNGNILTIAGNTKMVEAIERAQVSQYTKEFAKTEVFKNDADYSELIKYLNKDDAKPLLATLIPAKHVVVLETAHKPIPLGDGQYAVYCYNPNSPQLPYELEDLVDYYYQEDTYIIFDTVSGRWWLCDNDEKKYAEYRDPIAGVQIKFYDPSKLKQSFFNGNYSFQEGTTFFRSSDIDIRSESNLQLFTINNNEIHKVSDEISYSPFYDTASEPDVQEGAIVLPKGEYFCNVNGKTELATNVNGFEVIIDLQGKAAITIKDHDLLEIANTDGGSISYEATVINDIGGVLNSKGTLNTGKEIRLEFDDNMPVVSTNSDRNLLDATYYIKGDSNGQDSNSPVDIKHRKDENQKSSDKNEDKGSMIPFEDVLSDKWYTDAVYYCRDKGYMAGKSNNKFDPNGKVTRATITQVLYAMEGKPTVKKTAGFNDLKSGSWYVDSVNWAASMGIVSGYSKDKFGPNDAITRQQMAAIMYQYAKYKKYDTSANGDIIKFKDSGSITKYAVTPMKWAVGHEIISGTNKGLEPKGTATRAQIAVILQAYDNNVRK